MRRRLRIGLGLLFGLPLGLVALYTLLGAWGIWRLDVEFERLRDEGLLAGDAAPESVEVTAARAELLALLAWEAEHVNTAAGEVFCVDRVPDLYTEAELLAQLEEREPFFAGLERLPSVLWERPGAPPAPGSLSLIRIRASSYALGMQAWAAGRDPGGGAAAGRSCARALAIARVQDDGTSYSLMIRLSAIGVVQRVLELLLEEGLVERSELLGPVQRELAFIFDDERLNRSLITDLVLTQDWERQQPWSLAAWLHWPRVMRERLGQARAFRQLKLGTPGAVLPGEDVVMPGHLSFCHLACDQGWSLPWWWGVGETVRSARARVAPLLLAG